MWRKNTECVQLMLSAVQETVQKYKPILIVAMAIRISCVEIFSHEWFRSGF